LDNSGTIDTDELKLLIKNVMDIDLSKKELKTIMKIADEDHSGTVDF